MTREFDTAEALAARAIARDPSCGWAWGRSGWLHSYRGNSDTAISHFDRALRLEPGSSKASNFVGIGTAHFNAGRYAAAAAWVRRALCERPDMAWANRSLSVSYARLGDRPNALRSLDALQRFCPDLTVEQVVAAVPFKPDFLDRLGDGLSALGLPA
jgi:adenylate cyclase